MRHKNPNLQKKSISGLVLTMAVVLLFFALASVAYIAFYPVASGSKVYKDGGVVVDASNVSQGYVMVKKKSSKKIKVRINGVNEYTYDLVGDDEYHVFPLQDGNSEYRVAVFERVKGNSYAQLFSKSMDVELEHEHMPFLVPNVYCWYTEQSEAVKLAQEMFVDLQTDKEKVDAAFAYITERMVYDYDLADQIVAKQISGYVPDLDTLFEKNKGICFDFSALMCAMLRSQGIPTKLIFGYADGNYHAWNSILIEDEWVRFDATAAITLMDIKEYTKEAIY